MWDKLKDLHKFHERIEEMQKLGGLRIWILHVLDEYGSKNGVEIMDAVQVHQEGLHQTHRRCHRTSKRPSSGSIYPMLKKMVSEGLITKKEDGRYELTEKGQEINYKIFRHFEGFHGKHIDRGTYAIENILIEIDGYVSYLEDIKREKLVPHREMIGLLNERIKKINESIHEE